MPWLYCNSTVFSSRPSVFILEMFKFTRLPFCLCLLLCYKQKNCIRWNLNGFLTLCFLRGFTDSKSKASEFQSPWIKIFDEAKGIFLYGGMPYLFTHGKHPAVSCTSVLLHLKIFFTAVNARLSPVTKMMFVCGLRGQFFQAVLYIQEMIFCVHGLVFMLIKAGPRCHLFYVKYA